MQREEIEKMAKEGVEGADKMLEILNKCEKQAPQDWKTRLQKKYRRQKAKTKR